MSPFGPAPAWHGFDTTTFVVQYIGLPVYLGAIVGYKTTYRTRRVKAGEADLVDGVLVGTVGQLRAKVKAERELGREMKLKGTLVQEMYRKGLSWLF